MVEEYDCIVIGAGPAGLIAGVTLQEAGRRMLVLEARDHIGGRAHSKPLSDGSAFERGAQLVHGATVATWELLVRLGLTTHFVPMEERRLNPVFENGEWNYDPEPDIDQAYRQLAEALDCPDGDNVSLHEALVNYGFSEAQMDSITSTMRIMTPIDPHKASSKSAQHAWSLVSPESLNFSIVEGYSELWRRLSEPIMDSVRFDSPVSAVEWGEEGVRVHYSAGAFEAKTAIVTASLGVLQSGKIEFTPELPEKKGRAVEELGMGPLIKVVVEFRRPFWEDALGKVLGFQHGDSLLGSYSSHFWDRPGPPTLIMFLGADRAEEFKGDPGRIRSMMFGELGEMFPGVDLEEELVSLDIVDWAADPWALGGVSVGTVDGGGLRADLASPTPPLYWAGEATAEGRSAECVHGALETGRRAAIEVLHAVQPLYVDQPEATLDWRKYIPS